MQIDEPKFGKRKKNRSRHRHMAEAVWVLFREVQKEGNVYHENNKYFLTCIPDRSTATLLPIIKKEALF